MRAGLRMRIQTEDPGKAVLYVSVGKGLRINAASGREEGEKKYVR